MTEGSFVKVVLLGDSGVGKTCLRGQFVHHVFTNAYKATIGGDFLTTAVQTDAGKCTLQVWDTAGQERFNLISQAFYRGADVCVLVYDVTNYESVLGVRDWFSRFLEHCHVDKPGVLIVGNKTDNAAGRCVDREEIRDVLCRDQSVPLDSYVGDWDRDLLEVLCKLLADVQHVFQRVAQVAQTVPAARPVFELVDLSAKGSSCAC